MRKWLATGAGLLVLVVGNMLVLRNEELLREGEVFYLELAPRDPRALLQGDYMALNYAVANSLRGQETLGKKQEGWLVLKLDARRVAGNPRVVPGRVDTAENEILLPFRSEGWSVSLLTNAYFFEEGQAARYQPARFGMFRGNGKGRALLVSLCDERLQPL